jgi:hypothetical protein
LICIQLNAGYEIQEHVVEAGARAEPFFEMLDNVLEPVWCGRESLEDFLSKGEG